MKINKLINRIMMSGLLVVSGIVASCGNTGEGTSGVSLTATCDTMDLTVGVGDILPAGFVIGRVILNATKPKLQGTQFGNDTILDSTTEPANIPAAGLPVYIDATIPYVSDMASQLQFEIFGNSPVGTVGETLPTVFFTDDQGRIDIELRTINMLTITDPRGWTSEGQLVFQVRDAATSGAAASCDYSIAFQ